MVAKTASAVTEYADTMCFVDHHSSVVFLLKLDNLREVGCVTFHRENAVGHDEFHLVFLALLELLFERSHVVVLIFQ